MASSALLDLGEGGARRRWASSPSSSEVELAMAGRARLAAMRAQLTSPASLPPGRTGQGGEGNEKKFENNKIYILKYYRVDIGQRHVSRSAATSAPVSQMD